MFLFLFFSFSLSLYITNDRQRTCFVGCFISRPMGCQNTHELYQKEAFGKIQAFDYCGNKNNKQHDRLDNMLLVEY